MLLYWKNVFIKLFIKIEIFNSFPFFRDGRRREFIICQNKNFASLKYYSAIYIIRVYTSVICTGRVKYCLLLTKQQSLRRSMSKTRTNICQRDCYEETFSDFSTPSASPRRSITSLHLIRSSENCVCSGLWKKWNKNKNV